MQWLKRWHWLTAVGFLGVVAACAAESSDESADGMAPYPGGSGGSSTDPGTGGSSSVDAGLPPEEELESSYESPVATGRYVWVANPLSGRIAFVDAVSLEVRTTQAGNGPNQLAAIPHATKDVAVVINEVSSDATVLRADDSGAIDSVSLPIAQQSNSWTISNGGRWAIAWTDARLEQSTSAAEGFQDITVLDLTEGAEQATRLSVGYRPVAPALLFR